MGQRGARVREPRRHLRRDVVSEVRLRYIDAWFPRAQATVLLALAGGTAFLFSVVALRMGLDNMAVRYAVSTAIGYGAFLLLLRLWIALQRGTIEVDGDLPVSDLLDSSSTACRPSSGVTHASDSGDGLSALDFDDLWLVVVAGALALASLLAVLYVVYAAPLLLAEVALDAALVTGLYRRLRKEDSRHWLDSAIALTWVPAGITAVSLALAGVALEWAVPGANSFGDVWRSLG